MSYASWGLASQGLVTPRPILGDAGVWPRVVATTNLPLTTVTAGSPANTKGAWVELFAAATVRTSDLEIFIGNSGGAGTDRTGLMDLGFGAAASEVVVIPNIRIGSVFGLNIEYHRFRVRIPKGVRIAARVQSATASTAYPTRLELGGATMGQGARSFSKIRAIGADTATSLATALPTPGAANTKGDWTTLEDPVTEPIYGLSFSPTPLGGAVWQNATSFLDVGVGAAGSEVVLVPDIFITTASNETASYRNPADLYAPFLKPVPAGARLAGRYQTTNTAQAMGLVVYAHS